MEFLFSILDVDVTAPTNYGWFHLMFMALIVIATVLLTKYFMNTDDKTFRKIALIGWLIMVGFEIYKQFVYTFEYTDGKIVADYQWYAFPYQLCSTPLYILPFVAFMKEGKAREFFTSYISTFAFFGGLVVFFYPNDVFCDTLGINIQTMVHHGLQVVLGVYFAVYQRKKLNIQYFLKGLAVFAVLSGIAILLNEVVFAVFNAKGIDETFNMFYISRHFPAHLPVLSDVYNAAPYLVFLIAYLIGFSLAGLAVLYAIIGIIKLVNKYATAKN